MVDFYSKWKGQYVFWPKVRIFNINFSVTEQLSCTLQGKDTTIQEAKEAALLSGRYLRKLRCDEEYSKFYDQIVQSSQGLTDEPILPGRGKSQGV